MSASQPAYFHLQEFSDIGGPLLGGRLYTYTQGTTAFKAAYTDPAGAIPQTYTADGAGGQYIALNARGELPATLYLTLGAYDIVLKRADGSTVWTRRAEPTPDGAPSGASLVGADDGAGGTLFTTVAGLIAKLLSSAGAILIGFMQAGAGAIASTLQRKARERVSVQDYMTAAQIADSETGNPTMDATASLQAATDYLFGKGGGEVLINCVLLLKGSGGIITGRVTDGVKVRSNVSYRWEGAGEVRLHLSCVIGFTTRILAPVTSLADAPHDINFYNPYITRPGSTWDINLENTALLYLGAINRCKILGGRFVGWPGDAIMLGANDKADLTALLETYVFDVEIDDYYFDGVNKDNRQAISIFEGVDVRIGKGKITRTTRTGMPGAIDIEPILASAKIANIRIDGPLILDDIGGSTGAISFALGVAMTLPAHDFVVQNVTFRNISNRSDLYALGRAAPTHTATIAGSPYTFAFRKNIHDSLSGATPNRRYHVGGISGLTIDDNDVYGGNAQGLLGYDDGVNKYPLDKFCFKNNRIRNWWIEGTVYDSSIVFFGGINGGDVDNNEFWDCGNLLAGSAQKMTVLSFISNGLLSKNVSLSNNKFYNNAGFSVNSFPIYAPALTNPLTFYASGNSFYGLNSVAYNSVESIYSQALGEYYPGVVPIPSTGTPVVCGATCFNGATGDTYTNFLSGKDGQRITIISSGFGCTVANNANIKTATGANVVVAVGRTIALVNMAGVWYQD